MQAKTLYKNPAPGLRVFLVVILILRIVSYFVLTEDLGFTQFLKAGLRTGLSVTVISSCIVLHLRKEKAYFSYTYLLPSALYLAYLALGASSLLWTTSVDYSLLQLAMDFEGFVFAFFFMRLILGYQSIYPGGFFDLNKILAPAIGVVATGFAIGKFIDPDTFFRLTHGGEVARLGGYIINPNELGMLLGVGAAAFLPLLKKDEKYRVSILLIILGLTYLLFLTGSRSSFMALMLVVGIFAFQQRSKTFRIILAALMIIAIPVIGLKIFVKQGDVQEVMSLTGRLPFWKDLLTYNFPREPWFGYGYMRIDYTDKFDSLNAYAGAMTHNTFLQVLLGLGLTGLLLVLLQLSTFIHAMATHRDKVLRRNSLLIFIPVIINSFTEFGIYGETNYGILFFLFLVFALSIEPGTASSRIHKEVDLDEKPSNISFRPVPAT